MTLLHAAPHADPRTMFDDVSVGLLPVGLEAVAGYIDGRFANLGTIAGRFPRARRIAITVIGNDPPGPYVCADIEAGDMIPAHAGAWAARQVARPNVELVVLYSSVSMMPLVLRSLGGLITHPKIRFWTAHYTFRPHLCPECGFTFGQRAHATQWTDKALGRSLDESELAADFWPRPSTPALPAPPPFDHTYELFVSGSFPYVENGRKMKLDERKTVEEFDRLHERLVFLRRRIFWEATHRGGWGVAHRRARWVQLRKRTLS